MLEEKLVAILRWTATRRIGSLKSPMSKHPGMLSGNRLFYLPFIICLARNGEEPG